MQGGTFTDANGVSVALSKEQLQGLVNTYNLEVEAEYSKIQANKKDPIGRIFLEKLLRKKTPELSLDEVTLAPVTTEHTLHNSFVVGRVLGLLEFKEITDTYGEIWGKLFISTKEYVDKVKGGILNQISMAFYPDSNKLEEISFTVYGAIDGVQIIKMSQNGIKPDKTMLASTIGELGKKLSAINNEITDIDTKLSAVRNKRSLERPVLGLVQFGKIYPRDRDLLVTNLVNMSSDNDRNILLSTIKLLSNAVDLRVYNKNKQAFRMEELVMSKDKTVLVQTAEEINVQNEINQINGYGLNIQANNLITALKNSYVNLLDLSKNLSINNSSQYISYPVPYAMSIRELCFKNNLYFDDVSVIQNIIAANPGKFASTNKIVVDTVLLLPRA